MPDSPISRGLPSVRIAEEQLVASVSTEAFKAMFYLFAGKPDSRLKLFTRKVQIDPDDIQDLNRLVLSKLKLHNIDQIVSTCSLTFEGDDIVEFGVWAELQSYDWKNSNVTNALTLKWDFLIKLEEYATPQRHTLTVRISNPLKPQEMLRLIMSDSIDESSEIDQRSALCTARVDFISHRLADELLEVVKGWNLALKQPRGSCGLLIQLEKIDNWVARFIHLTFPVLLVFLSLEILDYLHKGWRSANIAAVDSGVLIAKWLLISSASIFAGSRLSYILASKIYHAINAFGAYRVFKLTRGDENAQQRADELNTGALVKFWINIVIALILNIVAGVITWIVLPGQK